MAQLYNQSLPEKITPIGPKKETIDTILRYSQALTIGRYKKMIFDIISN